MKNSLHNLKILCILSVKRKGVMSGVSEETFAPKEIVTWSMLAGLSASAGMAVPDGAGGDAPVTREEMVEVLYRTAVERGMDAVTLAEYLTGYADEGEITENRLQMMNWAVGAGILRGRFGGRLAPRQPVTRAELAEMLQRFDACME